MLALGKASQHHELEVEHAQREEARVAAARARREERIERFMNPSQRMYGQDFAGKLCVTHFGTPAHRDIVLMSEGKHVGDRGGWVQSKRAAKSDLRLLMEALNSSCSHYLLMQPSTAKSRKSDSQRSASPRRRRERLRAASLSSLQPKQRRPR